MSCFDLTEFFITIITLQRKFREKQLVKLMLLNFSNFNFWKNPKLYLHFLHNLVIFGPGKCKIWNLGIKISKLTKFKLWEMMRSKVWFSNANFNIHWNLLVQIEHCAFHDCASNARLSGFQCSKEFSSDHSQISNNKSSSKSSSLKKTLEK